MAYRLFFLCLTALALAGFVPRAVCVVTAIAEEPTGFDPLAGITAGLGSPVRITASIERSDGAQGNGQDPKAQSDVLTITATLEDGWHLYSLGQKPGGPMATRIVVAADSAARPAGVFSATPPPTKHTVEDVPSWKGLVVEEHAGTVTWRANLVSNPSSPAARVHGSVTLQLCRDNACTPPETIPFSVSLSTRTQSDESRPDVPTAPDSLSAAVTHTPERGHLQIEAAFGPPRGKAGEYRWPLTVKLLPQEGWHLYAPQSSDVSTVGQGKPTIVSLSRSESVLTTNLRVTTTNAALKPELVHAGAVDGPIIFELILEPVQPSSAGVQADAPPSIDVLVGFQTCTEATCDLPWAVRLKAQLPRSIGPAEGSLVFSTARYAEVAQAPTAIDSAADGETLQGGLSGSQMTSAKPLSQRQPLPLSLPLALLMGLAGGLILNLMPCVLPVLGLKLMSFAQQSGRARQEILILNLWYCAGLYAVFFVLATASVAANLGLAGNNLAWGEQFASATFNIVMCGIVFAFALSFLGTWELPIPGFIGERAGQVQSQEGAAGSFLKGVLSTVLATPCSGPYLGPVFGFTLTQTTAVTYAVFAAIATGMSLPYLLVGAFPSLVKFLPKPGAWMETLKEFLGFVMLGTVVYLFTFLGDQRVVPTFSMLIGIWAACWWVGRAQQSGGGSIGYGRWLQAAGIVTMIAYLSFLFLGPVASIIEWEKPFSRRRLLELRQRGDTVMVDFSADWCPTCKFNLATAIETNRVKEAIRVNQIVPMLADWTDGSPEIKSMLESLESKSIPVLAFFPATQPGQRLAAPIVLRDLITESQVLAAIREAGPSQSKPLP
ncbi:MAG: thioredoxin family protein [Planctomycetota bacterium]